jgi:hypothetical protein
MTLWKMVDFLILIKTLIQIALTTWRAPQNVPLMRFSRSKSISFCNWSDKLVIKSQHFIKQFTVFNMITFLISVKLHCVRYHLFFSYSFKDNIFWLSIFWNNLVLLRTSSLTVKECLCNCMRATHWRIDSSISNSSRSVDRTLAHSIWK